MPNQELVNFIVKSLELGASQSDIKERLLSAGWKSWDIDVAFSFIEMDKRKHVGIEEHDIVGEFPEPVIEKIATLDDLVCDMLKRGKSRDEIFDELSDVYDYKEIKTAFDKNIAAEEKRMTPSASLGFIMVAMSFISFLSITWDKLAGDFRAYAIILFGLLYFIAGIYIKHKEKILVGGEVISFFSVLVFGVAIILLSDNSLASLAWTEDLVLWMFLIMMMGVVVDSIMILKFSIVVGMIPLLVIPFMMIKNGEPFFDKGMTSSGAYLIIASCSLLLTALLIGRKTR
ncbi:MAG: hypothetical protein BWY21_00677 [Parcubacteria group bacterium ADurb.Bin216]|jgi:hypothetical protein|nr:MAG: hypothetical protein BWY21_00677 [Parcubacteria group bacterium ADurb.Bin216]